MKSKKNLINIVVSSFVALGSYSFFSFSNLNSIIPSVHAEQKNCSEDEKKLLSIKDKDGNPIFSPYYADSYLREGGNLEFALELAGIKDREGNPIFDGFSISSYWKLKGRIDFARQLAFLKDERENPLFKGWDICLYKKHGGTLEEAQHFLAIKNTQGKSVFKGGTDISKYKELGGTLEEALKFIYIKNDEGNTVFSSGTFLSEYKELGGTLEEAQQLANIRTGSLFRSGFNIWDYKRHRKGVVFAQKIANIKDRGKKYLFDAKHLIWYSELDGTPEFAERLARTRLDDQFRICRLYQLGITVDESLEFNDTAKPNAIVVYPTVDRVNAFQSENSVIFFKKLKEKYDIYVVIADTENEVYDAINRVPRAELLVIGGHGSYKTLSLGEQDLQFMNPTKSEIYTINTSDNEFEEYLKKLHPRAVIFLNSCNNASPGNEGINLADFVIKIAGNRKVIASKKPFSDLDIIVNSIYPFDIKIKKGEEDLTYTNK